MLNASTIPDRPHTCALVTLPRLLKGLFLCAAILLPAASPANACGLDWADVAVVWPAGSLGPHTFPMTTFGGAPCPAGLTVTISVTKPGTTSGTFGAPYPAEDCAGCSTNEFGSSHDLGVIFDPNGRGLSPVVVTATFSAPFPNLRFEVSDIDFSNIGVSPNDGAFHRMDEIVITSDVGNPTLSYKTAGPNTFSINPAGSNKATANCSGPGWPACNPAADTTSATEGPAPPEAGTVVADFGALAPTTVTITYNEASPDEEGRNPIGRGVGLLANLTPVELLEFSVE